MTSWVLGPGCLKRITNVLSVITVHSDEMQVQTSKNSGSGHLSLFKEPLKQPIDAPFPAPLFTSSLWLAT